MIDTQSSAPSALGGFLGLDVQEADNQGDVLFGDLPASKALAHPLVANGHGLAVDGSASTFRPDSYASLEDKFSKLTALPRLPFLGFPVKDGGVNYSDKLAATELKEVIDLMKYFANLGNTDKNAPPPADFSLNLETLIRETGDPAVPEKGKEEEFTKKVKRLRELTNVAVGVKLSYTEYPIGHCTSLTHPATMDTGHYQGLKNQNLKFEEMDLIHHLDGTAKRAKDENEYNTSRIKALEMYYTTEGLMRASKNLLNGLQERANSDPITGSRRKRALAAIQEKAPHEALTLFGAINYVDGDRKLSAADYRIELERVKNETLAFIRPGDERPSNVADRQTRTAGEALARIMTYGIVNIADISDENKKIEDRVAAETALLSTYDRTTRVRGSNALGAEERSDGQEKFFVQLAHSVVYGAPDDAEKFMNSPMADLMLHGMDQVDKNAYKTKMLEVALGFGAAFDAVQVKVMPQGSKVDSDEKIHETNKALATTFKTQLKQKLDGVVDGKAPAPKKPAPKKGNQAPTPVKTPSAPIEMEMMPLSPKGSPNEAVDEPLIKELENAKLDKVGAEAFDAFNELENAAKTAGHNKSEAEMKAIYERILPDQLEVDGKPKRLGYLEVFNTFVKDTPEAKALGLDTAYYEIENGKLSCQIPEGKHIVGIAPNTNGGHWSQLMADPSQPNQFIEMSECQGDKGSPTQGRTLSLDKITKNHAVDMKRGRVIFADARWTKAPVQPASMLHNNNTCALIAVANLMNQIRRPNPI